MSREKEDRFDMFKRAYPYPLDDNTSCSLRVFRPVQSGAKRGSAYVEPCLATPKQLATAESHRPMHTCVDDFLPGYCPACNRIEWLEAARAAQSLHRVA